MELKDRVRRLLAEILPAEQARAQKLAKNPSMAAWVRDFRKKFITDGFLYPLYAKGGFYSVPKARIEKYGNFILPYDNVGEAISENIPLDHVLHESLLFWEYLALGQSVVFPKKLSKLPKHIRLTGIPGRLVWQSLLRITKETDCFGENGGGLLQSPQDLDAGQLGEMTKEESWQEGEDGFLEPYYGLNKPVWMHKFDLYDSIEDPEFPAELRPAWYHIARYAFFNIPLHRLPVFTATYSANYQLSGVKFLHDDLANPVRKLIADTMAKLPLGIGKVFDSAAFKRERREMTWWLWKNVGCHERKGTLSYGEIELRTREPRATISTAVKRFDDKLRPGIDNKMLEQLLITAGSQRLGYNLTYRVLTDKGLVPRRERELDSFDRLDELI